MEDCLYWRHWSGNTDTSLILDYACLSNQFHQKEKQVKQETTNKIWQISKKCFHLQTVIFLQPILSNCILFINFCCCFLFLSFLAPKISLLFLTILCKDILQFNSWFSNSSNFVIQAQIKPPRTFHQCKSSILKHEK